VAKGFALAFVADERGATAIEYGLICSLIFLVIIGSVTTFGTKSTTIFLNAASAINGAI
jgi:pilus assembly protein Flp/PilA